MKCVSDRVLSHLAVFDHVHSIDTRVQMVVCFDPGQTSAVLFDEHCGAVQLLGVTN